MQTELNFNNARFNGSDYVHERDHVRLGKQLEKIFDLMKDGEWRALHHIQEATGEPAASISAQLRHLRKARFGGHTVNKKHVGEGLFLYQLILKKDSIE